MDNGNGNLGKILKQRMSMLSLTLHKLAAKSGVSPSYLGRVENGERFPSARILRKLAEPLGFTKSELFTFADYLPPSDYLSTQFVENGNEVHHSNLDPNIASALAQEPPEVQRAVYAILSALKYIARGIPQEDLKNRAKEIEDLKNSVRGKVDINS